MQAWSLLEHDKNRLIQSQLNLQKAISEFDEAVNAITKAVRFEAETIGEIQNRMFRCITTNQKSQVRNYDLIADDSGFPQRRGDVVVGSDIPASAPAGEVIRYSINEGENFAASDRFFLDPDTKESTVCYSIYFDSGFNVVHNGKIPSGFAPVQIQGSGGFGGNPSDGTNAWSVRSGFVGAATPYSTQTAPNPGNVLMYLYTYHTNQASTFGDGFYFANELALDTWHDVELYMRINDVNANNGILSAKVGGINVLQVNGLNFTNNPTFSSINNIWNSFFHGGVDVAPGDAGVYIGDQRYWSS